MSFQREPCGNQLREEINTLFLNFSSEEYESDPDARNRTLDTLTIKIFHCLPQEYGLVTHPDFIMVRHIPSTAKIAPEYKRKFVILGDLMFVNISRSIRQKMPDNSPILLAFLNNTPRESRVKAIESASGQLQTGAIPLESAIKLVTAGNWE